MKIAKPFQWIGWCLVIVLLGCTAPPAPTVVNPTSTPKGDEMIDQASPIKSSKARISSPTVSAEEIAELARGNTAFALDLYRQLSSEGGNLFFSPYSISMALAMTQGGARGETLAQMNETLQFTLPDERLHPAFNGLDQELSRRAEEVVDPDAEGFRLNIANALWGQKDYAFRPEYLDLLAENYGAGMQLVDFSTQAEQARQMINDWIAEATEQKIKNVVPEGAIDTLTRLVLANAIYFNAAWLDPFDEEFTKDGPFHLLDGSEKTVPMMHQQDTFGYSGTKGLQVVELPYVSRSLVMDILMPAPGEFEAFEQTFDADRLTEVLDGIGYTEVDLSMPRFKYESSFGLSKVFKEMGMPLAFDPGNADFTGMAETNELYLQDVLHKAFVAVNEAGTEAAAATVVMAGATGMPPEPVTMTVDRPFVFLIRDTATGTILFIGRVLEP